MTPLRHSSRHREVLVWLLVAAVALVEALRLGIGAPRQPGPGFVPALGALVLGGLAFGLLRGPAAAAQTPPVPGGRRRLVLTVVALLGYAALFERLGFIVATFVVMWFLLGTVGAMRWPVAMGIAAGMAVAVWLVFDRALKAQLPRGVLSWLGS